MLQHRCGIGGLCLVSCAGFSMYAIMTNDVVLKTADWFDMEEREGNDNFNALYYYVTTK